MAIDAMELTAILGHRLKTAQKTRTIGQAWLTRINLILAELQRLKAGLVDAGTGLNNSYGGIRTTYLNTAASTWDEVALKAALDDLANMEGNVVAASREIEAFLRRHDKWFKEHGEPLE